MPYIIRGKCIYKKDGGAKVGCTKGDVHKYMAALHANVKSEEITEIKEETPSIFRRTIYRTPTPEELQELNEHHLNADKIVSGFKYTIIGKGMLSDKNVNMIQKSIKMLCEMFPENVEYKTALNNVNKLQPRCIAMSEDTLKGGLADKLSPKDIANKFNISVSKIENELVIGLKVETEHTNNLKIAKEIAMDHLSEMPDYYTRLEKMEKTGEKKLDIKEAVHKALTQYIRD